MTYVHEANCSWEQTSLLVVDTNYYLCRMYAIQGTKEQKQTGTADQQEMLCMVRYTGRSALSLIWMRQQRLVMSRCRYAL